MKAFKICCIITTIICTLIAAWLTLAYFATEDIKIEALFADCAIDYCFHEDDDYECRLQFLHLE